MNSEEVYRLIKKLKYAILEEEKKKKWNNVLSIVSVCASILYETNLYYVDDDLEDALRYTSEALFQKMDYCGKSDTVLFYDGFGLNERGLAQIYLKAICKIKKVYYVTYSDRKNEIPDLLNILENNDGNALFVERQSCSHCKQAIQLYDIVKKVTPGYFFFYSTPEDVVGTVVLNAYNQGLIRYQINLTDHAFWLSANCIDKCIEFRSYGANISMEYRHIPQNELVIIPFYPIIHYERAFEGFPGPISENQKLIFSGGALYKTIGKGNKYYNLVDYILGTYEDTVFWYAGSGDRSQIDRIIEKYPGRVYFTPERKDLFQVLKHCYFYLSTYPLCGGLMYQYAAMAGKVPITLSDDPVADDFLINQSALEIQFDDMDLMKKEIDHLIQDEEYCRKKGESLVHSVISEENFNREIELLLAGEKGNYPIEFSRVDTTEFQKVYLDNMTDGRLYELIARKDCSVLYKYAPIRFLEGMCSKFKRILLKKI